ncbi:MAG: transcription termination factor Rho [Acidobacteria bacterium]|jgi:transcription termination factor Rho|nr:transcription termination factor Rho [Acidobacteriota bacterium]
MSQPGSGLLKRYKDKSYLVDPGQLFSLETGKILVPPQLIKVFQLVEGVSITGPVGQSGKVLKLEKIESVCGLSPSEFKKRIPYTRLLAIDPNERFKLSVTGDPSMRIVELMAPIAKGTRGLIVSPPRAGKTMILEQIARSISIANPETRIIALLIDERPEEVTHFRRQVNAEVMASSNDRDVKEHVALTQLVMGHVITELECGRDVVVLVDSLTRMARAFNLKGSLKQTGRTMSGGLQAGAMEIPRRFFGLARNIENGGSLTIIATVLVDTGSRMDQLIFEEFKGTGNSEIILDRNIAEARVFPAINLPASGTRKEELLYTADELKQITRLRRALTGVKPKEAMELFLKFLQKFPTNEDFFQAKL